MTGAAERGHAARIREMLRRAGAAGTTTSDMHAETGIAQSTLAGALNKMVERREAQTLSHKHARMYWPAGVEITAHAVRLLCSRIDHRLAARAVAVSRIKHQGQAANVLVTPQPAQAAPVQLADQGRVRPEGPADESRARVTQCPSIRFDPRYQLDPSTRVPGGFAAAGIGRYLSTDELEAA